MSLLALGAVALIAGASSLARGSALRRVAPEAGPPDDPDPIEGDFVPWRVEPSSILVGPVRNVRGRKRIVRLTEKEIRTAISEAMKDLRDARFVGGIRDPGTFIVTAQSNPRSQAPRETAIALVRNNTTSEARFRGYHAVVFRAVVDSDEPFCDTARLAPGLNWLVPFRNEALSNPDAKEKARLWLIRVFEEAWAKGRRSTPHLLRKKGSPLRRVAPEREPSGSNFERGTWIRSDFAAGGRGHVPITHLYVLAPSSILERRQANSLYDLLGDIVRRDRGDGRIRLFRKHPSTGAPLLLRDARWGMFQNEGEKEIDVLWVTARAGEPVVAFHGVYRDPSLTGRYEVDLANPNVLPIVRGAGMGFLMDRALRDDPSGFVGIGDYDAARAEALESVQPPALPAAKGVESWQIDVDGPRQGSPLRRVAPAVEEGPVPTTIWARISGHLDGDIVLPRGSGLRRVAPAAEEDPERPEPNHRLAVEFQPRVGGTNFGRAVPKTVLVWFGGSENNPSVRVTNPENQSIGIWWNTQIDTLLRASGPILKFTGAGAAEGAGVYTFTAAHQHLIARASKKFKGRD